MENLQTNIKSILLYKSETWTKTIIKKLQTFLTGSYTYITEVEGVQLYDRFTIKELIKRIKQIPVDQELGKRY